MSAPVAVGTYTYNGKMVVDLILRPSFIGKLPSSLKVIETKGANRVIQTLLQVAPNVVKWVSGWQGGVAQTRKEKAFDLMRLKSELGWNKSDFDSYVQREAESIYRGFQDQIVLQETVDRLPLDYLLMGVDWSDFTTNPETQQLIAAAAALVKAQQMGVIEGVIMNYWLANPYKITYSAITSPAGASIAKYGADTRYNAGTGVWKSIEAAATTGTPTIDQIKRIAIDTTSYLATASVAQKDTFTLTTGSSGNLILTVLGTNYTTAYGTSLAATATAFYNAHKNTLALYGMTVTNPSSEAIAFEYIKGVAFDAIATAATSDITGSRAATTAAVANGAISTDKAMAALQDVYDAQNMKMKAIPDSEKVFYCTQSVIDNYKKSMVAGATTNTLMTQWRTQGIPESELYYNGVKIELMPIDAAISGDFGSYLPNRIILTTKENLVMIVSEQNDVTQADIWHNKDENETRTRTEVQIGGDYFLPELMVVAY